MTHRRYATQPAIVLATGLILLVLSACNQPAPPVDVDATVQAAIEQTRTFETQVADSVRQTQEAQSAAPADTPVPAPTATLAEVPEPTATAAPTEPPQPTPTKILIAESDVDGNDGNDFLRSSSQSNQGRVVLLPGFDPSQVGDPTVFRDGFNLRVEVFDTRYGLQDGAGIESVNFRIEEDDGQGTALWEKRETSPAYCVFGGNEPNCPGLSFANNQNWPDPFGGPINNGQYLARIDIVPTDGEPTQWRWRFEIDSPYLASALPELPANTARINQISLQGGRYEVDFETGGFQPVMPGQHVHFFFNSVPPEQAGIPGSGPWQLYPAGPGQPGTSPFTMLTVNDRPANATQMCILVANADHSVIQGTGNCVDLP